MRAAKSRNEARTIPILPKAADFPQIRITVDREAAGMGAAGQGRAQEHQYPMFSVWMLIGLHLLGLGLPVVPHSLQSQ